MNSIQYLLRICLVVTILPLVLFAIGCERWQAITYVNQTPSTVKVDLSLVTPDYTDTPTLTWNDRGVVIGVGESKKYLTPVPDSREGGIRYKYTVVAVTEKNEVVFSKVFTWDELHDMNWTVGIKAQK